MKKSCSILFGFFSIAIGSYFFTGCDSSTEPADYSDFFPVENGDYFVYESYETSTRGELIAETKTLDSLTAVAVTEVGGETEIEFEKYVDGKLSGTEKFFKKYDALYKLFDAEELEIEGANPVEIKIADFVDPDPEALRVNFSDYPVEFEGETHPSSAVFIYSVDLDRADSVEIFDEKYFTNTFRLKKDFKFEFVKTQADTLEDWEDPETGEIKDTVLIRDFEVTAIKTRYVNYIFAENLGLIEEIAEPSKWIYSEKLNGTEVSRTFGSEGGKRKELISAGILGKRFEQ